MIFYSAYIVGGSFDLRLDLFDDLAFFFGVFLVLFVFGSFLSNCEIADTSSEVVVVVPV